MKTILNILRGILGILLFLLLIVVLVLTPALISGSSLITKRENPKSWLSNSGIYTDIAKEIQKQVLKDGALDDSGIKNVDKIISEVITPTFVGRNSDAIIDGAYDFAEGKIETLTIKTETLDLNSVLKKYLTVDQIKGFDMLKNLKPCTEAQATKYETAGGFTSIKDMCLPPNLDILKVANDSYKTNITDNPLSSITDTFKSQDIPQATVDRIQLVFWLVSNATYILIGVLILISVSYILVFPGKFFKSYTLGFFTTGIGIINIFLSKATILTTLILSTIASNISFGNFPIPYATIEGIVSEILVIFFKIYFNVSLAITITGGIIFVLTIVLNIILSAKDKKNTTPDDQQPSPQTA